MKELKLFKNKINPYKREACASSTVKTQKNPVSVPGNGHWIHKIGVQWKSHRWNSQPNIHTEEWRK